MNNMSVSIYSTDNDFEVVSGTKPYMMSNKNIRVTNAILILDTKQKENIFKFNRYFSDSTTYFVDLAYVATSKNAIIEIYIDDQKNKIFSNLDTYSNVQIVNVKSHTITNITKGFHDIYFHTIGKNSSNTSSNYNFQLQWLNFN